MHLSTLYKSLFLGGCIIAILGFFAADDFSRGSAVQVTVATRTDQQLDSQSVNTVAGGKQTTSSGNTQPGSPAVVATTSITDIFFGYIKNKVGDTRIGSEQAEEYQVEIATDDPGEQSLGHASGTVLVVFPKKLNLKPELQEYPRRFKAYYDSQNKWYVISSAGIVIRDYQYPVDLSDDRNLVGASHNIFVGKVLREIGTKDLGIGPENQFEVAVISNVKGDLHGTVVVDQQAKYANGDVYIADETSGPPLDIGATYLLVTRYNPTENWYTVIDYPTAQEQLSNDRGLSNMALQGIAASNSRVQALTDAYPNEILLQADVAHGNTKNSYASKHSVDQ